MIGIIALFFIFLLFYSVHRIAKRFAADFSGDDKPKLNNRLYWGAISFFILVLLGDEIIGGAQMAYFCSAEPEIKVLVDDLKDRRVHPDTVFSVKENTVLEVKKGTQTYVDVETQAIVAKAYTYYSQGGWLSRAIAFNGSKKPLLFSNVCGNSRELLQLMLIRQAKIEYE